ncbi:MAG: hypothetical protein R3261_09885 [Alphaproteobacteria bacterium]|nr:hypothetical protein [Alphaproteobacteria bacterium]
MRMRVTTFLAAALVTTGVTVNQANANMATDLGKSVAKSIVGAIAGKGAEEVIGLIFGTKKNELTIGQVKTAIDDAFAKAELKDIQGEFNGIANQVDDYRPGSGTALEDAGNIVTATGNFQGNLEAHMTPQNSIKTIPLYVSVTNSRIAFAAERYRLETIDDNRAAITRAAISGLHGLHHYIDEKMTDPKRGHWPCVKKDKETKLNINGADGTNWTEKVIDVSTQYCIGNGRVLKAGAFGRILKTGEVDSKKEAETIRALHLIADGSVVNLNGAYYMKNTDMGRTSNSGIYMFARRIDVHGKEYFLEASKSRHFAHMLRNHYFLTKYPSDLGDLHAQVLAWVDIVQATGANDELLEALNTAAKLGIGWNTLKNRYNNADFENAIDRTAAFLVRTSNETRTISD